MHPSNFKAMSRPPMTRNKLQTLKAERDFEQRKIIIENIVDNMYEKVVHVAGTTTETSVKFDIPYHKPVDFYSHSPRDRLNSPDKEFYIANMKGIISALQDLFPGCTIRHSYKEFIKGQDGKEHDISTVDPGILPYVNVKRKDDAITVDWSWKTFTFI